MGNKLARDTDCTANLGPLPPPKLTRGCGEAPHTYGSQASGQHLPLSTGGATNTVCQRYYCPLLATCINSSTCGPARRLKSTNETHSAQFVGLLEMSRLVAAIPDWSGFYLVNIVIFSILYISFTCTRSIKVCIGPFVFELQ